MIEEIAQGRWPEDYLPKNRQPNLIFADPPYNVGIEYADDQTKDEDSQYKNRIQSIIHTLACCAAPDCWLWWMCPMEHTDWLPGLLKRHWNIVHRVVWYETFAQYNPRSLTKDCRMIYGVRRGNPPFNPDDVRIPSRRNELGDRRGDPRGRVPGSVWTIRRLQGTSLDRVDWHPAQLPPELLERIVGLCTNPGALVLDAFAGSGNMGLACRKLGRSFVLVDQSPTYIAKIKERLSL